MSDQGQLIDFYPYRDRFRTYHRLEPEGRDRRSILEELAIMAAEEDRIGDAGRVSGSIYHGDHDHYEFLTEDRKSTRLNSSHPSISYAVFCLKKKNTSTTRS